VERELKSFKTVYSESLANKDQYKADLEISTNYLLEVEERCQEAQNISLDLLQQVKYKEHEVELLRKQLELANQPEPVLVYKPVNNDPVD